MALKIDRGITPKKLLAKIERLFELSAQKILSLEKTWNAEGTPVFTIRGKYASRGWTEWTQGFQYGSALLQFDATGDRRFLELGRRKTVESMATHVSHTGVHDHGFNNVSTYGNLWRLMVENRIPHDPFEKNFYELALKISGAVQAARWTPILGGGGFIHSFNGPHSLFVDTMRSLRVLGLSHMFGHVLMGERDQKISLLDRLVQHAEATARYNIYFGKGRDAYDVRGRAAHESIFNLTDGQFRCPNSQQGYSAFSTWTRGLAWAILGFAELLEFLEPIMGSKESQGAKNWPRIRKIFLESAMATADYYLETCCADGIPMWDTGAPNLYRLGDYQTERSNPFNQWEPVDSSAAAIAAQGLLRLGNYLHSGKSRWLSERYRLAGLTIAETLFAAPYLSTKVAHQGLILHSVYHRPNGWDYVARGQKIPTGESSMWGDYHARELALMLLREAQGEPYLTFFGPAD
jgi:unsaturated chondroitin disaccharide hydrolase